MAIVEIAVESVESARAASAGGAQRIELCADLALHGGLTPGELLTAQVLEVVHVPVFAMVRPRPGNFSYSAAEIDGMCRTIERLHRSRVHGIVLGALTANHHIDTTAMQDLMEAAAPLPVTFHRAFDQTPDLHASLETLIELGVQRVLTGGGPGTASAGAKTLRTLVEQSQDRIAILAGGGVRTDNVATLIAQASVREVHSKLKERPEEEIAAEQVRSFVRAAT